MTYTFIHPTKCGGTAVERYFRNNYSHIIKGSGHTNICSDKNSPIIVIREPTYRFISMYNYWKNGSEIFKRNKTFVQKYNSYTVKDFINLLKANSSKDLNHSFTWHQHFAPQVKWLDKKYYSHTIVIKYEDNLNNKVHELLAYLAIEDKDIQLPIINISKQNNPVVLDDEDLIFIRTRYVEDFELWNELNTKPDSFKKVI